MNKIIKSREAPARLRPPVARAFGLVLAGAALLAGPALAQDAPAPAPRTGFYGGVSLNERSQHGLDFSSVSSAWIKFGSATLDDSSGPSALLYGGYRFTPRVSVEAAFARNDGLALMVDGPGMGLNLGNATESAQRRWNADVYTAYNLWPAVAVYGRLGYRQSEALLLYPGQASAVRPLEGVNVGVGLRYDMSPSLGLKLEYARFGRAAFDSFTGAFPESDQVQFGVQYRF